jgi:diaminopimelate epimerase
MQPRSRQRNRNRSNSRRNANGVNRRNNSKRNNSNNAQQNLLSFTKMHGLGNDFIVLDFLTQPREISSELVRKLADRNFGIGCDQLLIVEAPTRPEADFKYRIFNADGEEVEQCGNGARCFAKYVIDKKLTGLETIKVETNTGNIELKVLPNNLVEVNMGMPILEPSEVPFASNEQKANYDVDVNGETLNLGAVSMGNPHGIIIVDDVATAEVGKVGTALQQSSAFPNSVNVGFMQLIDRSNIKLRVLERGVGETLACGTGACAAVVSGILQGQLDDTVMVELPGGKLTVSWPGGEQSVIMTGPAVTVYEGQYKL